MKVRHFSASPKIGDHSHDRDRRKGVLLIVKVYWKHANMHMEQTQLVGWGLEKKCKLQE